MKPGDQCDSSCTTDCGHCKGAGPSRAYTRDSSAPAPLATDSRSTTYGQKCSRCGSWVVVVTEVRPQRFDQGLTVLCPVCICWPPAPGELLPQLHLEHGSQGLVDAMATLALEQLADG